MDNETKDGELEKADPIEEPAPVEIDRSKCVALVMGATCPNCGYERHAMNVEPHPVA